MKQVINTLEAPQAIGAYSQAIKVDSVVYLSGQIPLHPESMEIVSADIQTQARQVFANLQAVATAAGGSLAHIVKLTIYLVRMEDFSIVNQVMTEYCVEPYPARVTVAVSALPKGASVEVDAIMVLQ